MRIIHYYHIFADGRWQMLVNQHLMAVSNYGLANAIEEIRIGIVGQPANRKEVKAFLATVMPADRCKVVVERTTAWEQATLNEMYKASQEEPDAVYLYAHTKGGSLLIVGQSGTGKSSLMMQAAVHWALGRDFFGIKPARPLRAIILQAENDAGDVSEA